MPWEWLGDTGRRGAFSGAPMREFAFSQTRIGAYREVCAMFVRMYAKQQHRSSKLVSIFTVTD
jgi:hypothetical protein